MKRSDANSRRVTEGDAAVKVRITRKFAEFIDGVDLRELRVGDVVDVSPPDAALLLAEGWAQRTEAADRVPTPRMMSMSSARLLTGRRSRSGGRAGS